jgi:hypothetical protein
MAVLTLELESRVCDCVCSRQLLFESIGYELGLGQSRIAPEYDMGGEYPGVCIETPDMNIMNFSNFWVGG